MKRAALITLFTVACAGRDTRVAGPSVSLQVKATDIAQAESGRLSLAVSCKLNWWPVSQDVMGGVAEAATLFLPGSQYLAVGGDGRMPEDSVFESCIFSAAEGERLTGFDIFCASRPYHAAIFTSRGAVEIGAKTGLAFEDRETGAVTRVPAEEGVLCVFTPARRAAPGVRGM